MRFEDMNEQQLRAALGGSMAWQYIVQARRGGPEDCRAAVTQTTRILRAIKALAACQGQD